MIGAWKDHDNRIRPHSSLGYRPPAPVTHTFATTYPGQTPCSSLTKLGPKSRSSHPSMVTRIGSATSFAEKRVLGL